MCTRKYKHSFLIVGIIFFVTFSFGSFFSIASENTEENSTSVMKRDQEGKVSQNDFMQHHKWMFEQNDINQDRYLDTDEMRNLHKMVKKMHKHFEQQY